MAWTNGPELEICTLRCQSESGGVPSTHNSIGHVGRSTGGTLDRFSLTKEYTASPENICFHQN